MDNKIYAGQLAAEFIGSMFLVMAGMASLILMTTVFGAEGYVAVIVNAMAVGFTLIAVIEMFGPVSGAHINPVVTLIWLLDKKITMKKAAAYIPFQFAGGLAGTMFGHLMFYDDIGVLFTISETQRNGFIFVGEIIGTFILILAILLLLKACSQKGSVVVGLLVAGQLLATSSTMFANPQLTVARMFTATGVGIRPIDGLGFVVMQVIGALLAYGVYKLLFAKIPTDISKR